MKILKNIIFLIGASFVIVNHANDWLLLIGIWGFVSSYIALGKELEKEENL